MRPPFVAFALAIAAMAVAFAGACSSDAGTGTSDAGTPDAGTGTSDAGTPDAGTPDAGADAAAPDGAPSDGAPSDMGTSDALSDDAICTEGCQFAVQANCGVDESTCVGLCRQDFATGPCHAEKIARQLCLNAGGLDALECVNGRIFIKAGYCEEERHALTSCLN